MRGIDIREWSASRLSVDYVFAYDRLRDFYAGSPANRSAWSDAIARAQAHPRDRTALVEALDAQLAAREAPEQARAAARKLNDPRTVALVTGQQAGLFGGPLYTLLKALTAARLAADIEARHGVPCVTVFWDHGEDHDWAEVASTDVLDSELALHRLTVADGPGAGTRPVAHVPLPPDIDTVLDHLASILPATEFRDETMAMLRQAYRPGRGMAEAFGRLIDALLGPLGIVVFDGSDPAAKRWAVPLFTRVLQHPEHTGRLAGDAGTALAALGYHAQVTPQSDTVALFYMREAREPIRFLEGVFLSGAHRWTPDELLGEVTDHPERFSPNVLLRAVVQDTLLPTIAYVAGPSELAYLGQLREVYAFHGTPMPLIVPRASGTLLDSAALRFLDKHGLPLQALRAQDEAVLNALLEAQLPPAVEQALGDVDAALHARLTTLRGAIPALDPTLVGAVDSATSRVEHELRGLRTKVIHAAKRRNETLRRQFIRVQHLAFPGGHPQERTVGLAWFMNRYGPGLVPRLYESLPLESGRHWLLQI